MGNTLPKMVHTQSTPVSMPTTPKFDDSSDLYICHYCNATFRMRSYLTRHIKKHAVEKAFKCPYYKQGLPTDLRCHHSGGFSRRDTYKTHLRSRHIIFPKGVKYQDRNNTLGHCAECGQYCTDTKNWVELHIESGECTALPSGFCTKAKETEKSIIKTGMKMIKTSTGEQRYISMVKSTMDPNILLDKNGLEASATIRDAERLGLTLSESPTNALIDVGKIIQYKDLFENSIVQSLRRDLNARALLAKHLTETRHYRDRYNHKFGANV